MNKLTISKEVYYNSLTPHHMDELKEGAECEIVEVIEDHEVPHVLVISGGVLYYISMCQLFSMINFMKACHSSVAGNDYMVLPNKFVILHVRDKGEITHIDLNDSERIFTVNPNRFLMPAE